MPAPAPLFSVIVVCKNPGLRLRSALESVWNQRDVDLELVVIDGVSTDGTREWLDSQRSRLATFITEPDRGIYDAMNKGVAASRGEWLFILGADDRFASDTVLSELKKHVTPGSAGVIVGEALYNDGRVYKLPKRIRPLARNFVHHQAAFYHRAVFQEHGCFDASLRIAADYDFNLQLWHQHVRFECIPLRVASCGIAGVSDSGDWQVYREEITVRHRYAPAWSCAAWDFISILRFMRKQITVLLRRHGRIA
jgi:glycosyltransferase involved in cell wall biosynthesis